jgi:hypothetical protein
MAWMKFRDARRQEWLLQQEGLWLFCQQYAYAQLMSERARAVPVRTPWYSIGPNISNVEVDFNGFRGEKTRRAEKTYDALTRASLLDATNVFGQLVQMKDELDFYTARLAQMKHRVAQRNAGSIESHVSFFGGSVAVARFVRDMSATAFLTIATVATGGAAAGAAGVVEAAGGAAEAAGVAEAVGAGRSLFTLTTAGRMGVTAIGSAMKGLSTYEDSVLSKGVSWSDAGSVGAGLVQATSSFIVTAVPILAKLPGLGRTPPVKNSVLLLVKAPMSGFSAFAAGMAKGDGAGKSLRSAVASMGLSAIPLDDKLDDILMPLSATLAPALRDRVKVAAVSLLEPAMDRVVDLAKDKIDDLLADKLAEKPRPHVSAQMRNLVGVATRVDRALSNSDYVSRTTLCPA